MKCAGILLVALMLSGCLRLPRLVTPRRPETIYSWREKLVTKPKAVVAGDKIVVIQEEQKTLTVGYEKTTPKETFMQRVGNWISGLGMIAFIAIVAGLILCPGATLSFLMKKAFAYKRALKETVQAVKESRAVNTGQDLHDALAQRQSNATKKIVGNIKSDL